MRVVIAGGHGQIALVLERLLSGRGDNPVGLVRNPAHADDLAVAGAEAVVCDLESATADELAGHLKDADAVVFAAGAGPNSGTDRKDTVDRAAAVLLAEAAVLAGIRRYLLVSSMGVGRPLAAGSDESWTAYIAAKTAAEDAVRGYDFDWTVLRPGALTNDAPTGRIRLETPGTTRGTVTRADVAAVLVALLDAPATAGLTLELIAGEDDIPAAVAAVSRP
ncbi:SDR family oxidoreductase [Kutzneria buriramensis]|uniref:Putative NAD(P)-binding protein n=1 Tax=Kutzneria buriramensis TaxID=1045776 RepID=A0A3E0HTM5_9PSEU|nr:SDR family oxidoreductase [Kutzneria buriramensis]REH49912.1 putative NAD(P)-binding protein [Kutzneria buriramensis]